MSENHAFPDPRAKPKPTRVLVVAAHMTPTRGQMYSAYLIPDDYTGSPGKWTPAPSDLPIVASSRNPEFEACRWLQNMGTHDGGPVETWRPNEPFPALTIRSVAVGAGRTVVEGDCVGPLIGRYHKFGLTAEQGAAGV